MKAAWWLVAVTALYNLLEAGIALYAAVRAESVALLGFGLDSIIELAASAILLWRLGIELKGESAERIARSERLSVGVIGVTFLGLALFVLIQSAWTLWHFEVPSESYLGIGLAGVSLILMPILSWVKLRAAREIGSQALRAEAKETLACSYLSFALLLGLSLNAWVGWWWADPVAALLMVPWLAKEGWEGITNRPCGTCQ